MAVIYQENIEKLEQLGLKAWAQAYAAQSENPATLTLDFDHRLSALLDQGIQVRGEQRLARMLKRSGLKVVAYPEQIRYGLSRGLDKSRIDPLLSCDWIARNQNLLITGLTGVGKTWLSCAFAVQAARKGLSIKYLRLSDLFLQLETSRGIGLLYQARTQFSKVKLLILDDFGLAPMSARSRQDLFEIIDDRCESSSLIVTSQFPVAKWHDYIADATLADAILDRLVHSSHKIELQGDSQRGIR